MASGETLLLFSPLHNEPPAANAATFDSRNQRPCLDFDPDADEEAVFSAIMPSNYAGGGVTVSIWWAASTDNNAAHECYLDAQWEDWSALDLDGDGFAAVQSNDGNPNGVLGVPTNTQIAFANGAEMDNVVAGDPFRLKVIRDADHVDDDMTGDCEIYLIEVFET